VVFVEARHCPVPTTTLVSTSKITTVRTKMAKSELAFSLPILAKMAVRAANPADRPSQNRQEASGAFMVHLHVRNLPSDSEHPLSHRAEAIKQPLRSHLVLPRMPAGPLRQEQDAGDDDGRDDRRGDWTA
jgi:hypothetical protein